MNTTTITVEEYAMDYSIGKIPAEFMKKINSSYTKDIQQSQLAPPEYQRKNVWTEKENRLYISSVIEEMAYNPIIVIDVEQCLKHSTAKSDEYSIKMFKKYNDAGIKFLSIDGQNRSHAITGFLCGRFTMIGTITDKKGRVYEFGDGTYFHELDENIRERIVNKPVLMQVIKAATFGEVKEVFCRLNSGVALSPQEKRNAMATPIAQWSRDLAKKFEDVTSKVVGPEALRMEDRQLIVRVGLMLSSPDLDSSDIEYDKWFEQGCGSIQLSERYNVSILKERVPLILNTISQSFRKNQEKMNIKNFVLLVLELNSVFEKGKTIRNAFSFRNDVQKKIKSLCDASRKRLAADIAAWENNSLKFKEPKTGDYFHAKLAHLNSNTSRNDAFSHFQENFSSSEIQHLTIVENKKEVI